ncbi:MAG: AraC family transcriptional regulator [Caldilineaceae bacterium]|nr:AraC family transcriptional regulator [Caldilineaceae bacterium]
MSQNGLQRSKREQWRMQASRQELQTLIAHHQPQDGVYEALPGLYLNRSSRPTELRHSMCDPAFCVIVQGSKEMLQSDNRYRYDPENYLLTTIDLPVASRVVEASQEKPYLSLRLNLTPALVSDVMMEAGEVSLRCRTEVRGINVSPLDGDLLEAAARLVRLADAPGAAAFLMPLTVREIIYRLLLGKQGDRLRQIAVQGGSTHRIAHAIEQLRENFDQPLGVDNMAEEVGMSVSSFHHHFKAVTGLSPLQFQKQMRLQEARKLMFGEGFDAATAGYQVGYNDASHFNREYKRFFGLPPMRDVEQLRAAAM